VAFQGLSKRVNALAAPQLLEDFGRLRVGASSQRRQDDAGRTTTAILRRFGLLSGRRLLAPMAVVELVSALGMIDSDAG
jgi:hypothetical protein